MKRALVAVAVLAGITLTGCATTSEIVKDNNEEVVIPYQGREIHCILTQYDRSASMSCDFERFYKENPGVH